MKKFKIVIFLNLGPFQKMTVTTLSRGERNSMFFPSSLSHINHTFHVEIIFFTGNHFSLCSRRH